MLYYILDFGHEEWRSPDEQEKIDPKDDTIRIAISCTLLDALREVFKSEKTNEFKSEKIRLQVEKYLVYL